MNKKIILIAVSVILLGSSVIMIYRTFFSTPAPVIRAGHLIKTALPSAGAQAILPYGKALDFSTIDQYNTARKQYPYPVVSSGEVGVSPEELIK